MNIYNQLKIILIMILVSIFCLSGCSKAKDPSQDNTVREYVVNKRTGKIHSHDCPSVLQMSAKNKLLVSDTLLNLLKQDYVICRRCRAGASKTKANGKFQRLFYKNLYVDEIEINASKGDYLKAINEMSEWYVDHVPTYASYIQDESYSDYDGNYQNYREYKMTNKGNTGMHIVLTPDTNAGNASSLRPTDQILRGTENAALNYLDHFKQIDFERKIAYYPCELLSPDSDYNKAGDDCVRYLFTIFSRMDSQFVKKYALLTRSSYSRTDSATMATNYEDIAYGFINLGFKIYDTEEQEVDVDGDNNADGYVFPIDDRFQLQKGDILARDGHVHIYLGDGIAAEAANFGWGRVYRSFPRIYEITVDHDNGSILLKSGPGHEERYRRVYRYLGR